MIPAHYKLLYKSSQIADAASRVGKEVGEWAKSIRLKYNQEVLTIPILRGGIFFFADLARQVPVSMEVLPGRTRSYKSGVNAEQLEQVSIIIDNENIKNRSILLVDDICDSGRTLNALTDYMKEHGANEVRSAVLIHRIIENAFHQPDWKGFEFKGQDWFVGYGMEDKNSWSNLPDIYTIQPK